MNYSLDCEFSALPWEDGSTLISLSARPALGTTGLVVRLWKDDGLPFPLAREGKDLQAYSNPLASLAGQRVAG